MQQLATYEAVARACERLLAEGQRITGDSVTRMTGGSKGTVLQHIRTWREKGQEQASQPAKEIPVEFQSAVLRLIGQTQQAAAEDLRAEVAQAQAGESEALEALTTAEARIEKLVSELDQVKTQAEQFRQENEKAAAVAAQEIESLQKRVEELETERRQLIEAGEAARTEAAKAQLQVERADQAAVKAEARAEALAVELVELRTGKTDLEKRLAVSEARGLDLIGQVAERKQELADLRAVHEQFQHQAAEKMEKIGAAKDAALAQAKDLEKEASVLRQELKGVLERAKDDAADAQEAWKTVGELRDSLQRAEHEIAQANQRAAVAEQKANDLAERLAEKQTRKQEAKSER